MLTQLELLKRLGDLIRLWREREANRFAPTAVVCRLELQQLLSEYLVAESKPAVAAPVTRPQIIP